MSRQPSLGNFLCWVDFQETRKHLRSSSTRFPNSNQNLFLSPPRKFSYSFNASKNNLPSQFPWSRRRDPSTNLRSSWPALQHPHHKQRPRPQHRRSKIHSLSIIPAKRSRTPLASSLDVHVQTLDRLPSPLHLSRKPRHLHPRQSRHPPTKPRDTSCAL